MTETIKQLFERYSIEDLARLLIEECPEQHRSLLLSEMSHIVISKLWEHENS